MQENNKERREGKEISHWQQDTRCKHPPYLETEYDVLKLADN